MMQHIQEERNEKAPGPRVSDDNYHGWAEFQKARPSAFRDKFNPILALGWLKELEKLFKVLKCSDEQKVEYATYMLADEALKAMHVTLALNSAMSNVIAPLDIKNYAELVNRCWIVARNLEKTENINLNNKRPMNYSKGGTC
ncbi:uncharacterized protein G2W53_000689 [Senna tora]|uniref:Uncharacterized protein n=1 Tax=Senna tora TaxID=362788 RepID=A0A834XG84_9FABA|nr:uncharacterized protein G2W53_000689 [Senna tora]